MSRLILVAILLLGSFAALNLTPAGNQLAMVIVSQTDEYTDCLEQIQQRYPNHSFDDGYEVTRTNIETSNRTPDLVFKLIGRDTCGTSGCIYEICLRNNAESQLMNFSTAASALTVLSSSNNGMSDLTLTTTDTITLNWNGERYTIAE